MNFHEFAHLLKQYNESKAHSRDFILELFDAILDDKALEKKTEPNPLYGLNKSTLTSYFSRKQPIPRYIAAAINPRTDSKKFSRYIASYSKDARKAIAGKLADYGFDVGYDQVSKACGDIFAHIIRLSAEGLPDDVTTLEDTETEKSKKCLRDIPLSSVIRSGNKFHINGATVNITQLPIPDNAAPHEELYIAAICEVFAEHLKRIAVTEKEIPFLEEPLPSFFKDQRKAYYSAVSIERSIRDVYEDGESEFQTIKSDAWEGINMTLMRDYKNGYDRLITVLEQSINMTLNKSVLCQIRDLISNLEKKGICHILVNDGIIKSWVSVNGR